MGPEIPLNDIYNSKNLDMPVFSDKEKMKHANA